MVFCEVCNQFLNIGDNLSNSQVSIFFFSKYVLRDSDSLMFKEHCLLVEF